MDRIKKFDKLTDQDLKDIEREALTPLYMRKGIAPDEMEALYKVGYDLYQSGNFANAETVFKGLVILDVMNEKFRMALAGALQAQQKWQAAVDQYGIVASFVNMRNTTAALRAAECLERLGAISKAAMAREQAKFYAGKAVAK